MLGAYMGKVNQAAYKDALRRKGYKREGPRDGQPVRVLERKRHEAHSQMKDAQRLRQYLLRAAQSHELCADKDDDDGCVEDVYDDAMAVDGAFASRL